MAKKESDIEIDMYNLMGKVYKAIAEWHNEVDESMSEQQKINQLKIVSQEVIHMVLGEVVDNMGVKSRVEMEFQTEEEKEGWVKKIFGGKK